MVEQQPKIALVTGAGTGIGRAASLALAEIGFAVAVTGRRVEPLERVAAEITLSGGTALAVTADVGNVADVRRMFSTVMARFGRLDLLFNNAGMNAPPAAIDDVALSDWEAVINVNLTGAFMCTQEAFRIMKNQTPSGGRIVNNGSIASVTPRPHSAAYAASKHAITGLTKSTALDGRQHNIACGQLDIGNAATAIGSHVSSGALQPDGSRLVEPMLDLAHVAGAIKYMAGLPLDANVLSMIIMATKMPFVGRG